MNATPLPDGPIRPYLDRSGKLVSRYDPIVLSAVMGKYGYWSVTLSAAPGVYITITCARVGISRSEAIGDALATLAGATAPRGGTIA